MLTMSQKAVRTARSTGSLSRRVSAWAVVHATVIKELQIARRFIPVAVKSGCVQRSDFRTGPGSDRPESLHLFSRSTAALCIQRNCPVDADKLGDTRFDQRHARIFVQRPVVTLCLL